MATRTPAEVFPPGDILKEELEARQWTQLDLAEIIGRHVNTVNDIIVGKRGISPEIAEALSAALGTSAELWMNLDTAYQLHRVRSNQDAGGGTSAISRRAKLYAKAPVKDMIRRGWLEPSDSADVLESRVCRFLEIEHIDDEPVLPLYAARKATAYDTELTPGQTAWLFRAKQLAHSVHAAPFSERNIDQVVDRLRLLFQAPQEVRQVPRILAEAGIRFVVVQPLPGSRIDGACFWVDDVPVVAQTLRFDRIDNFWFVLLHELDHASKRSMVLDTDLDKATTIEGLSAIEQEANRFAVETLVPSSQLESFINRVGPFYSADKIKAFAHVVGVHPAIVVDQLQHRGEIAYSSFRKMLAPVREWITPAALTDGWDISISPQS